MLLSKFTDAEGHQYNFFAPLLIAGLALSVSVTE